LSTGLEPEVLTVAGRHVLGIDGMVKGSDADAVWREGFDVVRPGTKNPELRFGDVTGLVFM
jgi:hypothetical protein